MKRLLFSFLLIFCMNSLTAQKPSIEQQRIETIKATEGLVALWEQVCGHISSTGKPTPPFPYSIDYSASKQIVKKNEWQCVAMTYDGEWIKSYLNGNFEPREPELIDHTKGFEGYPDGLVQSKNPYYFPDGMGNNKSDFTVGAVLLKSGMGNFFIGQIGGLAVFNRALNADEIKTISVL